jgi:hypothetical protein
MKHPRTVVTFSDLARARLADHGRLAQTHLELLGSGEASHLLEQAVRVLGFEPATHWGSWIAD